MTMTPERRNRYHFTTTTFIYKKIRNVDTRAVYNTMIGSSKFQEQMEQLETIDAQEAATVTSAGKQQSIEKAKAPKKIPKRKSRTKMTIGKMMFVILINVKTT